MICFAARQVATTISGLWTIALTWVITTSSICSAETRRIGQADGPEHVICDVVPIELAILAGICFWRARNGLISSLLTARCAVPAATAHRAKHPGLVLRLFIQRIECLSQPAG